MIGSALAGETSLHATAVIHGESCVLIFDRQVRGKAR